MKSWFLSRSLDGRDVALDVFRGLAVAGMILVNNSGPGRPVYAPLEHAPWHGWTFADLVYPGFLFIVGVSIVLSLSRAATAGAAAPVYGKIVRRTVLLFAVGLMLVGFPYYEPARWPLTGVLQSIAVCYLVASLLYLHTTWRVQALVVVLICIGYWLVLALVPAPGFAAGTLTREGNLAGYLDRRLLAAHMLSWDGYNDPSGLLATLSGVATVVIGMLAAQWLRSARPLEIRMRGLLAAGASLTLLGLLWDVLLPINKNLWTGSFVAFSAGTALLTLVLLYALIRRGLSPWLKPLEVFGVNAILLYAGAYLLQRLLFLIRVDDGHGTRVRLRNLIFERVIDPVAGSGELGTLLYCLLFLSACLLVLGVLYRYRLYVKL